MMYLLLHRGRRRGSKGYIYISVQNFILFLREFDLSFFCRDIGRNICALRTG